jgi:predicted amidophosphoribosyltransferase
VTFPATRGELTEAGWELIYVRNCKKCQKSLEFWRNEKKKLCPLEIMKPGYKLQSHFATCPFAESFRKPEQPTLFEVKN